MDKLATVGRTREMIEKHGFSVRKQYGQNFLVDPQVPERIARAAKLGPEDCVLEIGPGMGSLTECLAAHAGKVVAVEIDRMLIPVLEETVGEMDNVTILHQDIMKTDLADLCRVYNDGKPMKVVANLPYYITTPIIMKILESRAPIAGITVMVQKEVAQRMVSGPGGKDYGALSLAVQYHSKPSVVMNLPPHCFMPRPKVDSAVVHLDCEGVEKLPEEDEKRLMQVIRGAFTHRRKTLANSLRAIPELMLNREDVEKALRAMNIPGDIRAEKLTLQQFEELAALLRPSR